MKARTAAQPISAPEPPGDRTSMFNFKALPRTLALGLTAVVATAGSSAAAASAPASVGSAHFDHGRLVIPVTGSVPKTQLKKLAPRQYIVDLAGSVLLKGEAQGQRLRSAALAGWSLDEESGHKTVRLRMTLTTDATPTVVYDAKARGYVVTFAPAVAPRLAAPVLAQQPHRVAAPVQATAPHRSAQAVKVVGAHKAATPIAVTRVVAPAPRFLTPPSPLVFSAAHDAVRKATSHAGWPVVPMAAKPIAPVKPAAAKPRVAHRTFVGHAAVARIDAPRYDADRGVLIVPYTGDLSNARLNVEKLSARWRYLDLPNARPSFTGVKFHERSDRLFQRWVMAKRPGRDTTRLSFALGGDVAIDVKREAHHLLIAVRPSSSLVGAAPVAAPVVAAKPNAALALAKRNPVAGVIETRLRRPFYDTERFGLVIPYEGRTPFYRWKQKADGTAILELKGDVVSASHLQPEVRRHGSFGSWTFGRTAKKPGSLTVAMSFAKPSELVVAADVGRKQLVLIPQPRRAAIASAMAETARAALATIALGAEGTDLFIPYTGEVPRYTLEQVSPNFAYINFERASLSDPGVQFYAPDYHPTLKYWMVTQPAHGATVRIAVALARPAAAAVYQDPANGRLVISLEEGGSLVRVPGAQGPRLPDPWPGAMRPGEGPGEPVSFNPTP